MIEFHSGQHFELITQINIEELIFFVYPNWIAGCLWIWNFKCSLIDNFLFYYKIVVVTACLDYLVFFFCSFISHRYSSTVFQYAICNIWTNGSLSITIKIVSIRIPSFDIHPFYSSLCRCFYILSGTDILCFTYIAKI